GNALVGRYFTLLNLPMKAIVFATAASPHELNWLDHSNYVDAGIDVQFVDDWAESTVAVSEFERSELSPAQTKSVQSSASTEVWDTIGHWTVMVDRTLGDSCFVVSQFTDGTFLRVGLDRKASGQSYLFLANDTWSSLEVGGSHPMTFQFDDEVPWEANSLVIDVNGAKALNVTFSDNTF